MSGEQVGVVSEVWRFPVKSMGGERVDRVDVDTDGVAGDRQYAVRDLETGLIASAKRPGRWGVLLHCVARQDDAAGVRVSLPDGTTLPAGSDHLDEALSELTGRRVRLERFDAAGGPADEYEAEYPADDHLRLEGRMSFPTRMVTEARSFVDLSAVHVITDSTMAAIAEASGSATVTSARFRPSVVVRTGRPPGYVEDDWRDGRLRLGSVELGGVGGAPRCIMTAVAQPGLERDNRIFRAIAREHRIDTPDNGPLPCAGLVAEVTAPGVVAVGDLVALEAPASTTQGA